MANRSGTALICDRCGFVHTFAKICQLQFTHIDISTVCSETVGTPLVGVLVAFDLLRGLMDTHQGRPYWP